MARPDYLVLGRITKVHGVRGEVKAVLYADDWRPFRGLGGYWMGPARGTPRPVEIQTERVEGRSVVLKLAGVDTREAAAGLVGQEIAVRRADAPPPPEGAFYHYDILWMEVVRGARTLGVVREILETSAHDVYVVRGSAGEWLLPATRVHIRRIDVATGTIEMDPAVDLVGLAVGPAEGERGSESV